MYTLIAVVGGVCCLALGTVLWSWRRPELGLDAGRLRPCPGTPNCVCSQDVDAEHSIPPLQFSGDPAAAWQRMLQLVETTPGAALVAQDEGYLRAEFTTPVLRFVDDLELLLDAANRQIHVRSASRVGRSDLGVNRRRIEELRRRFAAAEESPGR